MERIRWQGQTDEKSEPTFNDPNPVGIPTVRGYRFNESQGKGHANIRIFQYTEGDWGVQVTVQRGTKAASLASAKRKAAKLLKLMTEQGL